MNTIEFINEIAALKDTLSHARTAANYRATARALERYLKSRNRLTLSLKSLTPEIVADFEHHLLCERKVCRNTSSFYMRQLRAVYNIAVGRRLCRDTSPFRYVYTGIAQTYKRAAQPSALKSLFTLQLAEQPHLEFARDLFYFTFLGRGIAFVDLAKLSISNIHGNELIYHRSKTGQLITLELIPAMWLIINRWHVWGTDALFPILPVNPSDRDYTSALRRYNRHLAALEKLCGGGIHLNSYTARHSWASEAYRLGVPIQTISSCMGHTTEHTTRIYIKSLATQQINNALLPLVNEYT